MPCKGEGEKSLCPPPAGAGTEGSFSPAPRELSPAPDIAQDQHQIQQGPAETPAGLQSSSSEAQTDSRGCRNHSPVQRISRILGSPFPGSGSPLQGLFCPTGPPHPASQASCSSDTGEEGTELQPCIPCHSPYPSRQTDINHPYHQQDDGSGDKAEAAHNDDGHAVLRKAWLGRGGLQGVLWNRVQLSAQPQRLRPASESHPPSLGTQPARHKTPVCL